MYQLHHGDSLVILKQMPDASVDAVITDPPYSSGGLFRGDRMAKVNTKYMHNEIRPGFTGDNKDQRGWAFWCTMWLSECYRVAKEGAPICMFIDWRQLPLATDVIQAGGWIWRGITVWDKTEGVRPTPGRFRPQAEYVIWGSKGDMPLNYKVGCLPGVYRYPVLQKDKHHVTGKPTALMTDIVKICPEKGLILDPFAGSGTTGVAALKTGRFFVGIEMDRYYFEVAQKRLGNVEEGEAI